METLKCHYCTVPCHDTYQVGLDDVESILPRILLKSLPVVFTSQNPTLSCCCWCLNTDSEVSVAKVNAINVAVRKGDFNQHQEDESSIIKWNQHHHGPSSLPGVGICGSVGLWILNFIIHCTPPTPHNNIQKNASVSKNPWFTAKLTPPKLQWFHPISPSFTYIRCFSNRDLPRIPARNATPLRWWFQRNAARSSPCTTTRARCVTWTVDIDDIHNMEVSIIWYPSTGNDG